MDYWNPLTPARIRAITRPLLLRIPKKETMSMRLVPANAQPIECRFAKLRRFPDKTVLFVSVYDSSEIPVDVVAMKILSVEGTKVVSFNTGIVATLEPASHKRMHQLMLDLGASICSGPEEMRDSNIVQLMDMVAVELGKELE